MGHVAPPPTIVKLAQPATSRALVVNAELYAQKKDVSGTKAKPAAQPIFGYPYPANGEVVHPYSTNWISGSVTGGANLSGT